jgi:hypothetical protein
MIQLTKKLPKTLGYFSHWKKADPEDLLKIEKSGFTNELRDKIHLE